jgi:hypothetical protein
MKYPNFLLGREPLHNSYLQTGIEINNEVISFFEESRLQNSYLQTLGQLLYELFVGPGPLPNHLDRNST